MRIALTSLALIILGGCSDDTTTPAKEKGVAVEKGVPGDGGQAREGGGSVDGSPAVDFAAVCKTFIPTCSGSKYWTGYINPFTPVSCETIFACVSKLYTPTCLAKFKGLAACLGTISSAAECDSKCALHQSDVGSNCPCPASCGVKGCPADAGI